VSGSAPFVKPANAKNSAPTTPMFIWDNKWQSDKVAEAQSQDAKTVE
jgi:hypothetical protein